MQINPRTFAYLFERFPAFTQTFCAREVLAMERRGWVPLIFSVRESRENGQAPDYLPASLAARVRYLPPEKDLVDEVRWLRRQRQLPAALADAEPGWRQAPDKSRFYEAAWLGWRLREAGVEHVHVHFAGLAARTAFWMKKFWDVSFSLSGHANDIFRTDAGETPPPTLADLLGDATFIATESDFAAGQLRARFPGAASKVFRVFNGLDPQAFPPPGRPGANGPEILAVGRLIEKKGFADLVVACAHLRAAGVAFRCRIVGEGPLRESLGRQIAAANLGNVVELTGARTQAEIAPLLAAARVFTLPCVEEADGAGGMDNLPTVIAEAMAAGLPVVSTCLAGVPEMVAHGRTGLLVPPRSPEKLAAALGTLLRNASLAGRLGRAGRRRARRLFDAEVSARALGRLLAGHSPLRPPAAVLRGDAGLRWREFWREQRPA